MQLKQIMELSWKKKGIFFLLSIFNCISELESPFAILVYTKKNHRNDDYTDDGDSMINANFSI